MDRNYPPDIFGDESLKEIRNNEATTPMESSPIKRTRQGQQGAESVPRGHEGHAMGEETLQRNGADQVRATTNRAKKGDKELTRREEWAE